MGWSSGVARSVTPDTFTDDSAKVIYALPYLKGTALALTSRINVPWFSDYSKFVSKLRIHFGQFNPEGEAKAQLENLCMCDNQRITKYPVKFNRVATRVQWGNTCEGDTADKATMIDYSKTGANKR